MHHSRRPALLRIALAAGTAALPGCFLPDLISPGGDKPPPEPQREMRVPDTRAAAAVPSQAKDLPGKDRQAQPTGTPPAATPGQPAPAAAARLPVPGSKLVLGPDWEFRTHVYRPVNGRGENELGNLIRNLSPQGWEIHHIQVNLNGQNLATFRRSRLQTPPVRPGLPGLPQSPPPAPTPKTGT